VNRWTTTRRVGVIMLLSALLGLGAAAAPAQAEGGYTVSGRVMCLNSASPVGIWVEAARGGSGWADTWIDVGDGWGYVHYSKSIPNGGPFHLNVGCGGTPQSWGMTATSDSYETSSLSLKCNDIPWWLEMVSNWRRIPFHSADLTQGVQYGRCHAI
jgi:hypothetical protein